MRRVTLGGKDLTGFTSLGFDDHIKLFFGEASGGGGPTMRDYTPRYDSAAHLLHVDFAIHEAGPATAWAEKVKVGDELNMGGPRGSAIIPVDFDWHLLVGDETGIPAIGRRLMELPPDAKTIVIIEVGNAAEEQTLPTAAAATFHWVHRDGRAAGHSDLLLGALRDLTWPSGDGFVWSATESGVARAIRKHVVGERSANSSWVKTAGYWRHGTAAVHDKIED